MVRHTKNLHASRMMNLVAVVPLLLQISICGCLPLYHALLEASFERGVSSVPGPEGTIRPAVSGRESVSAGLTPARKSFHFCAVCAFTKGMNGAFLVSRGQLLPPSLASSALVIVVEATSRWNRLHPVSRAPPTKFHG